MIFTRHENDFWYESLRWLIRYYVHRLAKDTRLFSSLEVWHHPWWYWLWLNEKHAERESVCVYVSLCSWTIYLTCSESMCGMLNPVFYPNYTATINWTGTNWLIHCDRPFSNHRISDRSLMALSLWYLRRTVCFLSVCPFHCI
jgi:hypothetical protein